MKRNLGVEIFGVGLAVLMMREGWMQIPEETRRLMCSIMICVGPVGVGLFFAIVSNAKWMSRK
ncbi:MAG: hypothetical protein DPW11_04300 [bacterium]|nr:hypothetical protein [Candidatus Microgenomates bacterium CPR3]MCQ3944964.1 hypothetical protein [bacterium]RIK52101.1 MAG: hypothetical protein DCC61_00840 [Candidatus Microgenomates bacterium]